MGGGVRERESYSVMEVSVINLKRLPLNNTSIVFGLNTPERRLAIIVLELSVELLEIFI